MSQANFVTLRTRSPSSAASRANFVERQPRAIYGMSVWDAGGHLLNASRRARPEATVRPTPSSASPLHRLRELFRPQVLPSMSLPRTDIGERSLLDHLGAHFSTSLSRRILPSLRIATGSGNPSSAQTDPLSGDTNCGHRLRRRSCGRYPTCTPDKGE